MSGEIRRDRKEHPRLIPYLFFALEAVLGRHAHTNQEGLVLEVKSLIPVACDINCTETKLAAMDVT